MNSCQKGKVGEREFAEFLRSNGFEARRGRQFSGSPESPDVVTSFPFHCEVKRVERLNLEAACAQAAQDSGGQAWVVCHRRNRGEWLCTLPAARIMEMQRALDNLKRGTEQCRTCGGTMIGDGCTAPRHCENTEANENEADSGPIYCKP